MVRGTRKTEEMRTIAAVLVLVALLKASVYAGPATTPSPDTPPVNCNGVICAVPLCPQFVDPVVPPGECCAVCPDQPPPIDCSFVLCLRPVCPDGAEPVVPPGQCCPVCPDQPPPNIDCSLVLCLQPVCPDGAEPVVPPGQCCPVCPDLEDTACSIEGQVFTGCGSACPPTCANPNPICPLQCVAGCQCPSGTVLDERANKCVEQEECTCPPDCTAAFCTRDGNAKALCNIPGPREIPGCTGQCQLTFCQACYFSEEARDLPGGCRDCGSPISSVRCLRRWSGCIHRADIGEHGEPEPSCITQDKFQCYRYPCQLRG